MSLLSVLDRPHASAEATVATTVFDALEYSDNIVLVLAPGRDGPVIAAANPAAHHATGYPTAQLVGQKLTLLAGPETDAPALAGLLAAAAAGTSHRTQLRCRTAAGAPFWFGLHLMPAPHSDRCIVLGHDITAKLRARDQDQAAQALLAKVFVTVGVPVYITDLQGRFVMTNPAFDRLVGAAPGRLAGTLTDEVYTEASRALLAAGRAKLCIGDLQDSIEVALRQPDGERRCRLQATMIQRPDLLRFRIITVTPLDAPAAAAPPRITAAGRIQLIGLEEVRQTLGARWEEVKDRAFTTAEHVLRRALGPHDSFSMTDDGGFVVCFADASEEEAGFRAATIGREIRRRLIGEGQTPEVAHVFSAAVAVPPADATLPAVELAALVRGRIESRLRGIQDSARADLVAALEHATYRTQAVHARDRPDPIGWCVRLPAATLAAMEIAVAALPPAETAELDPDCMLLGFAQECTLKHALHAPGQFVFATLSPDILLVRKRMEACLAACRAMGDKVRQQLVIVVHAPPDGAARQLTTGLPKLRGACRFLGVAAETLDAADVDLRDLGINFMLVEAAGATRPKIKARADALHAQKCRLMLCGAAQHDAPKLFAEGADFVSIGG